MNWLDISSYIGLSIGATLTVMFIGMFATGIITGITAAESSSNSKAFLYPLCCGIFFTIVLMVATMLPTHNKILQLKISKIKNEAVNKENVTKGIDTLERIGKKLECKYLGCKESKE